MLVRPRVVGPCYSDISLNHIGYFVALFHFPQTPVNSRRITFQFLCVVTLLHVTTPQRRHKRCTCAKQVGGSQLHPSCIARTWLITVD